MLMKLGLRLTVGFPCLVSLYAPSMKKFNIFGNYFYDLAAGGVMVLGDSGLRTDV